jgi:hypothetical protein
LRARIESIAQRARITPRFSSGDIMGAYGKIDIKIGTVSVNLRSHFSEFLPF